MSLSVDVDHVRVRRAGIYPEPVQGHNRYQFTTVSPPDELAYDIDCVQAHLDDEGHFQVAVDAPGCPSISVHAHHMESPHELVRRASRQYLHIRPHTTVQASWPIEQPRSHTHLLHLMLDFDQQRTTDTTLYLVDCRGVAAAQGDFVVFNERKELTAGEIIAILRDKVTCQLPPTALLVNGRPLATVGVRRYVSPLIRLLSREQCDAHDRDADAYCPASFATHWVLSQIPGFRMLTDNYEAVLRPQFGVGATSAQEPCRGRTTTTTTAMVDHDRLFSCSSTTTTSLPGDTRRFHPHPMDSLAQCPIRLHLCSAAGDILTSTAKGTINGGTPL